MKAGRLLFLVYVPAEGYRPGILLTQGVFLLGLVACGCQLANPAQARVHPVWLRGRPGLTPGGQCGSLIHPGARHHCLQFDNMSQLKHFCRPSLRPPGWEFKLWGLSGRRVGISRGGRVWGEWGVLVGRVSWGVAAHH